MGKHLVQPKKLVSGARDKTMFFKPKSEKYADIVSIESPTKAKNSCKKLINEFYDAGTHAKRMKIIHVATLAANRAEAIRNKKDISRKESKEMFEVASTYRTTAARLSLAEKELFENKE
jgi:hypothetical protein